MSVLTLATFVLIGGGPSLTPSDVDYVRDKARVIAINDAYRLAPWAEVLYAADAHWWAWHDGVPGFEGQKYSIETRQTMVYPDVTVLKNTGYIGLELDPLGLRTGHNSGYQALNLAVHMGAKRIVLLGYDMCANPNGPSHWFGEHKIPSPSPYADMRAAFDTLVEPLAEIGVEVINCTRRTALKTFPCMALEEALPVAV